MSETAAARPYLKKYCQEPLGLDIGFGGDAIVPHALTFDQPQPYTNVGGDKQILRGDCRHLSMFCDESLDWIYSAHLLEDFTYGDLIPIIQEWRRVLKPGGLLVTNCPDQKRFKAYIALHNQGDNLAHKEPDFSLQTFRDRVLRHTGPWKVIDEMPDDGKYSWYQVLQKSEEWDKTFG